MTNKEAYLSDLDDLEKRIGCLLSHVPLGKTKKEKEKRERAENIAGMAHAIIGCMRNDYIPEEF